MSGNSMTSTGNQMSNQIGNQFGNQLANQMNPSNQMSRSQRSQSNQPTDVDQQSSLVPVFRDDDPTTMVSIS